MQEFEGSLIMVALFTCCVLALIVVIALFITHYDIMSPGPIFSTMFLLSTSMLLILGKFQLDIHWNTASVIITTCIVAIGGDVFSRLIIHSKNDSANVFNKENQIERYGLMVSREFNFFASILLIIFLIYSYWDIRTHTNMSLSSSETLLGAFREQGSNKSILSSMMNGLSSAIAYFYSYLFIINSSLSKPLEKKYWIPLIIYIPAILITGARIQLLFFLGVIVFQYVTIYFIKNGQMVSSARKLFIKLTIFLIIFCVIFFMAGFLTGKSDNFNIDDILLVYIGGPVYGLDWFMQRMNVIGNNGFLSFSSISFLLNVFGLKVGHVDFGYKVSGMYSFYPIFPERGLYGNVYTVLMSYIYDFGLLGTWIIIFSICTFLSWLYRKARTSKSPCIPILLLSIFYIPMLMVSIDNLFSDDLSYKRLLIIFAAFIFAQGGRKLYIKRQVDNQSRSINMSFIDNPE